MPEREEKSLIDILMSGYFGGLGLLCLYILVCKIIFIFKERKNDGKSKRNV